MSTVCLPRLSGAGCGGAMQRALSPSRPRALGTLPPADLKGSPAGNSPPLVSARGKQHAIGIQSFHYLLLLFIYLFIGKTLKTDG